MMKRMMMLMTILLVYKNLLAGCGKASTPRPGCSRSTAEPAAMTDDKSEDSSDDDEDKSELFGPFEL